MFFENTTKNKVAIEETLLAFEARFQNEKATLEKI